MTTAGAGGVLIGVPESLQGPISWSRIQPWLRRSHGEHNWGEISEYYKNYRDPEKTEKLTVFRSRGNEGEGTLGTEMEEDSSIRSDRPGFVSFCIILKSGSGV